MYIADPFGILRDYSTFFILRFSITEYSVDEFQVILLFHCVYCSSSVCRSVWSVHAHVVSVVSVYVWSVRWSTAAVQVHCLSGSELVRWQCPSVRTVHRDLYSI